MKRKKSTGGKTVRRLVALSAAAATMWTVGQTADWEAVAHSGTQLIQSAAWAERLVRQELIRPLEEGSGVALTGWEELVVAQSPALLLQRAALKEEGSLDSDLGRTKREQAAETAKEQKQAETKTAQKQTTKAKQKEKKSTKATKKLDTSKLKVADINLDNHTKGIQVNLKDYFDKKLNLTLQPAKKGPQILIVHTHTTEAYTKGKKDKYEETDPARTLNNDYNMVRVGEELAALLRGLGMEVVHDTTAFEPPNLSDAYTRSLAMLEARVAAGESYDLYIDLHRDAYAASQTGPYTVAVGGQELAHLMVLIGKGEGQTGQGFDQKPNWQENIKMARAITDCLNDQVKGLCRDVRVKNGRFNQHISTGCVLIEAGNNRNTLEQVLAAMPYLADAIAQSLEKVSLEK